MKEKLLADYVELTGMTPFDHQGGYTNEFTEWVLQQYEKLRGGLGYQRL